MTLQQLRDFLAVLEHGSFRSAARGLGVSQAGLTNSLQALETSLGSSLLVRSGRGVTLTDAGQRLQARAVLIDREAQRAAQEAASALGALNGSLHVGMGPTPTYLLLPRVVPDFRRRFPQVALHFTSGLYERLVPAVQQGLIDFAITSIPEGALGKDLASSVLLKAEMAVMGRRGHPMADARSLRALAGCEWILLGSPGVPGGTITRFFADNGLGAPRIAATCESFTQAMALVGETDALALLPRALIEQDLLGPRIAQIHVSERAHRFDVCLVQRSDVPLTPVAAAFAAMCASCARIVSPLRPAP